MEQVKEGGDLLYGAAPIAKYLGLTEKQARHRIDTGHIPSFRIGSTICARRSTLNQWLADQEAKAFTAEVAGK